MLIKIYDITAAIQSVYTVPSHRTVSGGPSLRSRNIPEITLLSLIIRVPGGSRGVFLPPLKPPSPPISVNKCLIVRCCHDKRLRVFRLWYDCFSQYLSLFLFLSLFQSKLPFFVFLRNILLPIEILKIKIPEYSDPPSQYFFINKAFNRSFLRRRKVVLCHLAEWHKFSFFIAFRFSKITKIRFLYQISSNPF